MTRAPVNPQSSDADRAASESRPREARSPSPARWAASGVLGGASVVGMLWATMGRVPVHEPSPPRGYSHSGEAARGTDERASRVLFDDSVRDPRGSGARAAPGPPGFEAEPEPRGETASPPASDPAASPPIRPPTPRPTTVLTAGTDRLDVNTATAAQLELLPRIGPALAARIIAFREHEGPIRSLTHLADVRGIGIRTIELIEPYLRFD